MATIQIIYWRDIPGQVIASAGRARARRALDPRFEAAIDRAAIRAKLHGTDDYLTHWRRSEPAECGDDLEAAVEEAAARIEADYPEDRLDALVRTGGAEAHNEQEKTRA